MYKDSLDNFIIDGGSLQAGEVTLSEVIYDDQQNHAVVNGDFCDKPIAVIEDKINEIDAYISAKATREYIHPTFEKLKSAKLDQVNAWTAAKITGGFISSCTGSPVRYDSDRDTQNTVSSDLNTIYLSPEKFNENFPNGYPMRGYPENANIKQVYFLTKEQLLQWNVDLGLHRGTCKQNGWVKQAQVEEALSKEDLDAIILD
ncbi:hypothetical protein [Phascolarctobacterium faecium]|uniref:DUF4376 domain-containing protein n=1 Tax=Phascolarctobacterium faecium TaxID=33025 RepID=UPI003AB71FC2